MATWSEKLGVKPGKPLRCRHCKEYRRCLRARRLCYACHSRPSILALYAPLDSVYNRRGVEDGNGRRPPPARPTRHPPGSDGKRRVLAARAAKGEDLWHPMDAGYGGLT